MSYKTELQGNNNDLQAILDKVNALPDAGGGSSTVPVEIIRYDGVFYYFDKMGQTQIINSGMGETVEALGGIIIICGYRLYVSSAPGGENIIESEEVMVYKFGTDGGSIIVGGSV